MKWSKVKPGVAVELDGAGWTVKSLREKKKAGKPASLRVELHRGIHRVEIKVAPGDKVKLAGTPAPKKRAESASPRAEAAEPSPRRATPPPEVEYVGDPWESPQDRTEAMLREMMGARLVAESPEGSPAYYVPKPGVTTIAAHLAIMHGGIPDECRNDEAAMLLWHRAEHERIDATGELPAGVHDHWHTETRPTRAVDKDQGAQKRPKKKGKKK